MRIFFRPWLAYAGLAVIIMGPLLAPGYILTLDMAWLPHLAWPSVVDNSYVPQAALHILNLVLPSWVIQKLVLLAIFFLAGLGVHRLAQLGFEAEARGWGRVAPYVAGILYTVNPFTYERLMAGQWLVLVGYALLPWFVVSLWSFRKNPSRRTSLIVAAWATAVGVFSVHMVFFIAIIAVVSVLVAAVGPKQARLRRKWLSFGALAFGVTLLASSYWIIPMALGTSHQAQEIATFTSSDTSLYSTDGGMLGLPTNVFALSGFWGDSLSLYELPWDMESWWIVPAIVLMVLAAWGFVVSVRARDRVGISLGIVALIAGVLAMGDAWAPTAWLWHGLVRFVPWFAGYREPQKFVALVALGEVYLVARAIGWGAEKLKKAPLAAALVPLVLALPFALTPSMLWGFHGQLVSANYPADWYALDSRLSHVATPPKSLFLPWHGYMRLDFAQREVANPASRFFATEVVAGDSIDRRSERLSPASQLVLDKIIPAGTQGRDVSGLLRDAGFTYVVLAKTADFKDYAWIDRQPGLKLVSDTESLKVYEVSHD